MDVETLRIECESVSKLFDETKAKKETAESEITELDTELYRLQGEYRVYQKLIARLVTVDPATTIVAKEDKKGDKNVK